ncbi:hypothetical protein CPC08DRAFT_768276 [Agrocybe pediades]|nr:hypothetical protein CPC08DRAFT_768276 [Agrocybe pediades]
MVLPCAHPYSSSPSSSSSRPSVRAFPPPSAHSTVAHALLLNLASSRPFVSLLSSPFHPLLDQPSAYPAYRRPPLPPPSRSRILGGSPRCEGDGGSAADDDGRMVGGRVGHGCHRRGADGRRRHRGRHRRGCGGDGRLTGGVGRGRLREETVGSWPDPEIGGRSEGDGKEEGVG